LFKSLKSTFFDKYRKVFRARLSIGFNRPLSLTGIWPKA